MLWALASADYVTASYEAGEQAPQGNLALFAVLFLVCCVEAVIVKVVSEGGEGNGGNAAGENGGTAGTPEDRGDSVVGATQ